MNAILQREPDFVVTFPAFSSCLDKIAQFGEGIQRQHDNIMALGTLLLKNKLRFEALYVNARKCTVSKAAFFLLVSRERRQVSPVDLAFHLFESTLGCSS